MKPDVHPIQDAPAGKSLVDRVHFLECALGRLWDQVWWMNLPWYRRVFYRLQGFRSPIKNFYTRLDE